MRFKVFKMKKSKIIIGALLGAALLQACNNTPKSEKTADAEVSSTEIIGKVGEISFPEFKVEETFVSDSVLHWKIRGDKDSITESNEKISYKKLNDNLFFISWIEKTGLTVSQVLDTKNGTATAFVSRHDEKSDRGQRSSNFFQGKLELKK